MRWSPWPCGLHEALVCMPATIIWDNDGMLVDTERLYFQATQEVMLDVGYELTEALYRQHFLQSSLGTWHVLQSQGLPDADIERLRAERDGRYERLIHSEEVGIDGAGNVLAALHGTHRMAVATSNRRNYFDLIHGKTGFSQFFELVVTADEVTATKPDPALYLRALERLGLAPEDCVAFEDSERGLRSAKGAGLRCFVVPSPLSVEADWSLADGVLESIGDVPELVRQL